MMYSRFNDHRYGLPHGQPPFLNGPRTHAGSPQPSSSSMEITSPVSHHDAKTEEKSSHSSLQLENEIPSSELNAFSLACIEQVCSMAQHDCVEQLISELISLQLPSYMGLKEDFRHSREEHQSHHRWTKQMYHAVEPLLGTKTGPMPVQQNLGELAVKCVEQDLQLHYRVQQLGSRISFLERAVPQHLIGVGKQLGLPEKIMSKLGKLVRMVMKNHA